MRRHVALACLTAAAAVGAPAHAASNVVQYTYDAAGNIIAIQRVNAPAPTVSGFTPTSGAAGTVVTISGTGFSATAANNVVAFNGVAVTVSAATANALLVSVPTGATTGKIAVTVAGNTATSAQDFAVTAPGAPTIAVFMPATGPAGTTVTVTGTNFNPAAGATSVTLNQSAATVSLVTTTTLAFAVPPATGSGRIRITTNGGSAVSAGDFIVPPGTIAAADIVASARIVANAAQGINILATNKYGLLVFRGNVGDWLSIHLANFAINPAGATLAYTVYKPDNTRLTSGTLSATSLSIHLPQLAVAGAYAVLLGSGIAQVSLDAMLESNRTIPSDGTTLAIARSAGQTTRALIPATAAEQKALMVSEMTSVPAGSGLGYSILLPSGATFRNGNASGSGTTSLLPPFTTTGTHPVTFTPTMPTAPATFKVGLLNGIPLTPDAAALNLAIANPGEGVRLNFVGVSGENLGLGMTGVVLSPAAATQVNFTVYKPDATVLVSGRCYVDGTECAANLANLPVAGNYSVIVQPANGATGTLQAWLSHDAPGTLVSGAPIAVALTRPGQNGRLTFPGTAGASVAVQVRGIATVPAQQGILVQIKNPDGTLLAYAHLTGAGQTLVTPPLPATGTYVVLLEPEPAAKGAATATMEVLQSSGQNLSIDGPTRPSAISVAGGSARFAFAATGGDAPRPSSPRVAIPGTDGAVSGHIGSRGGSTLGGVQPAPGTTRGSDVPVPTATGSYTVYIDPAVGTTANATLPLAAR